MEAVNDQVDSRHDKTFANRVIISEQAIMSLVTLTKWEIEFSAKQEDILPTAVCPAKRLSAAEDKTRYSHISENKTAWEPPSVDHPRQQASCENLRCPSDVCITEQDPMPALFLNERDLSAFRVSSIPIRALAPLEKISELR